MLVSTSKPAFIIFPKITCIKHASERSLKRIFCLVCVLAKKHACYSCLLSCLSKAPFTRSSKKYLTLSQKNATRGGFCPQKKNLCPCPPKSPSSKFKSKLHLSIVFSLSKESDSLCTSMFSS